MPSAGQAIDEAEEAPLEVTAQPVTEVMPLPMSGKAELLSDPIASTSVGMAEGSRWRTRGGG